ncbi:MAG: hypothetical protein ACSHYB_12230 [Roseibacillus sp.]
MNHAPSRPAQFRPVAYPVPAPSRVSVATMERPSILGVPIPTFGLNKQSTAIRDSRPSWPEPVAAYPVTQPVPTVPVVQPASVPAPRAPITRSFAPKGKVRLVNGLAVAPPDAPPVVHRAVAAGNRLQKMPYKWGGGHAKLNDDGYDCSGTVSYVLRESGLMKDQMTSRGFFNYGESGKGEWITVWVRDGHVFMIIGDLRLDTGGSSTRTGPRWKTKSRSYKGLVPRHPAGL